MGWTYGFLEITETRLADAFDMRFSEYFVISRSLTCMRLLMVNV